jgi:hypothetical protein
MDGCPLTAIRLHHMGMNTITHHGDPITFYITRHGYPDKGTTPMTTQMTDKAKMALPHQIYVGLRPTQHCIKSDAINDHGVMYLDLVRRP